MEHYHELISRHFSQMNLLSDKIRNERRKMVDGVEKLSAVANLEPTKLKAKSGQVSTAFSRCTKLVDQYHKLLEQYMRMEAQVTLKTFEMAPSLLRSRHGRRSSLNPLLYNGRLKPSVSASIIQRLNSRPYLSISFYIQQMYIAMKDIVTARLTICFK